MSETISVLIVDDNVEFGDLLKDYMIQEDDIRITGVARDGNQAINMIMSLEPDVVILDVIMPNLDGIGVLEKIAQINLVKRPLFIMLSAIGQDVFVQKAVALGAEYYVVKPFDVDILISRIRQIYREKLANVLTINRATSKEKTSGQKNNSSLRDIEVEVTNLMRDVGIPAHVLGYQFIREAIIQTINNSKIFSSITKVLYPSVAQKFNTTPQKVERAIRNAIEGAWAKGNSDAIDALFSNTVYNKNKPTNSEFIAIMADKVRIKMGPNK